MKKLKKIDWTNTLFLTLSPLFFIGLAIAHFYFEGWSWGIFFLSVVFYFATGISITAGYHRLFSHKAYQASWPVRFVYLFFGAGAFQNSCLKWCADHRRHHRYVDTESDPYNINEGFFHAHMGWIFFKEEVLKEGYYSNSQDLMKDPLVKWQHRYYLPIAICSGILLPTLIGALMGYPLGGIGIAALGRIVFVHHATFFINSLCHTLGTQPYSDSTTAKDSALMAFFTYGEGYHNFHHRFQFDYRNGVRWYDFDPSKWVIDGLSVVKLAKNKKMVEMDEILKAKFQMAQKKVGERFNHSGRSMELLKEKIDLSFQRIEEVKAEMARLSDQAQEKARDQKRELNRKLRDLQNEVRLLLKVWSIESKHLIQAN